MIPFLFAFALILSGCGGATVRNYEHLVALDLSNRLQGDQRQIKAGVRTVGLLGGLSGDLAEATLTASQFSAKGLPLFTEPGRSSRGKIRLLKLRLEDFELSGPNGPGLKVAWLNADIPDCRYDLGLLQHRGKLVLSRSGTGTGSVFVRFKDLETYLGGKYAELKHVTIRSRGSFVEVEGDGNFSVFSARVLIYAALAAVRETQIHFIHSRVFLDDHLATPEFPQILEAELNPLVDLDKGLGLQDALKITEIKLLSDGVLVSGIATIPVRREP